VVQLCMFCPNSKLLYLMAYVTFEGNIAIMNNMAINLNSVMHAARLTDCLMFIFLLCKTHMKEYNTQIAGKR